MFTDVGNNTEMSKKIKTIIAGCGKIAGLYENINNTKEFYSHGAAYHVHPNYEIIAAIDPNQKNLKIFCDKWNIRNRFSDFEKFAESDLKADLISICTP
ncbi:Gfo/Idh/MocA family oxidoreductase, partial [Candidatus Gracilibacteria bacterium]|nr:Gfo/Idh/MocA family oxidoreductase [Candidatus Gracilibacteria bacterium]